MVETWSHSYPHIGNRITKDFACPQVESSISLSIVPISPSQRVVFGKVQRIVIGIVVVVELIEVVLEKLNIVEVHWSGVVLWHCHCC